MQLKIESFRNCFSGLFIFINFHFRATSLIHLLDDTAQNFIPRKLRYRAKEIMSCTDNCAKETKQRLLVVVVSLEKKNSQIAQNSQV